MSDLRIKITVTYHQRQMLRMVCQRGGRVPYRFGVTDADIRGDTHEERERSRANKEGADKSIRDMAGLNPGLITIVPMVPPDTEGRLHELVVTDVGRKLHDEMVRTGT